MTRRVLENIVPTLILDACRELASSGKSDAGAHSHYCHRHVGTKNVIRLDVSVRDFRRIPYERSNEHRRRTAFADPRRLTENEIRVAAKVYSRRTVDCEVDAGIDRCAGGTVQRACHCQLEPGSAK